MLISQSETLRFLELTIDIDSEIQKEIALIDYLKSCEYKDNDKIIVETLLLDINLNNEPIEKSLEIREYIQENIKLFVEFLEKDLRDYSDLSEKDIKVYNRIFKKISFGFRKKIEFYRDSLD